MIPIYRPHLTPEITRYAHDAIDSGWVSSRGEYVERAEDELKHAFGYRNVLLTSSGYAAGHLAALALRHHYPEVQRIIVPNNVYAAAWHGFLNAGYRKHELYAVDCDRHTWQAVYSPEDCDERTDVILVVHNVSGVVNVPLLKRRTRAVVIEDACEGLFGTYEARHVGTSAFATSISFHGAKTVTSGEGGALVTAHPETLEYCRRWADQGATAERYVHDRAGFNFRMTNVQAALLYGQLLHREEILAKKRRVFSLYNAALAGKDGIVLQQMEEGTSSSYWMMAVRIAYSPNYARAKTFFHERGIETRPMFQPIWRHPHLATVPHAQSSVAGSLSYQVMMLPSYPDLTEGEVAQVAETVIAYAESVR